MCFFIDSRLPAPTCAFPPSSVLPAHLGDPWRYCHRMRPFTAIVVIGLLVLIVGAFVVKLIATGLTP